MRHLKLSHTDRLTKSVLSSIRCLCREKQTKADTVKLKMRRRTGGARHNRREANKLCRAKVFMAALTECYEMLNAVASTDA